MALGINHQHLAQSVLLEEAGSPVVIRSVILFSAILVITFIIWALIAKVDEVAIANGEIVPPGKLQQVQNTEGGRIAALLVKDGEAVKKDQVILQFDTFAIDSELREMHSYQQSLLAQQERLQTFLQNKPIPALLAEMNPAAPQPQSTPPQTQHQSAKEVQMEAQNERLKPGQGAQRTQTLLLQQLQATHAASRAIYQNRARQIKAGIDEINGRKKFLAEKKSTLVEELSMRTQLLEKGLSTKLHMLTLRRQMADVDAELAEITPQRTKLERELDEAADQLRKNESDVRERALAELSKVGDELAKTTEQMKRLEERLRQSEVRAPADGFAHGLKTHTIGGVINRGDLILEIVPNDKSLIAEIRIAPRDVGHVKIGQPVKLHMTAYDFSRFGTAKGTLADISPASFLDKTGAPYHRGIVALDQEYVGNVPGRYPIIPGMTLNANIKTGSKTLMTYLLKPIYASSQQAFKER